MPDLIKSSLISFLSSSLKFFKLLTHSAKLQTDVDPEIKNVFYKFEVKGNELKPEKAGSLEFIEKFKLCLTSESDSSDSIFQFLSLEFP